MTNTASEFFSLARLLERKNELDLAEDAYIAATNADPMFDLPWKYLGALYNTQQRYEEAETAYLNAIKISPEFSEYWLALSRLYLEGIKCNDAAVSALLKAVSLDTSDFHGGSDILEACFEQAMPSIIKCVTEKKEGYEYLMNAIARTVLTKTMDEKSLFADGLTTNREDYDVLILSLKALKDPQALYRIAQESILYRKQEPLIINI